MNHNKFQAGSQWRKWDLHIHTPASILNNQFGDDWDFYVKQLFKKAIAKNISAIGITDYFSIEGYKKIRREYLENETKLIELFEDQEVEQIKNILVIPNIEFRLSKLVVANELSLEWNRKVNFHILFSDQISSEDIEENFLHNLSFENLGYPNSSTQSMSLTKRNLIELGQKLKVVHHPFASKDDYFIGTMNASIDDKELLDQLSKKKELFKGNFLIGLPADEDLSQISWNSQGHLARKLLLQKSNFIFSSNSNTVNFGLGKFHSNSEEFKNEFVTLKPCIWGSDAHDYDALFVPAERRNTWIKANPTFEGLKQIIFEPEQRVKICDQRPEEKTPYLVMDKMRFIDQTKNKTFPPFWIYLNENLNTIIGGKSSGKSLLLYHLAQSIDNQQLSEKTSILPSSNDYDIFIKDNPFDFEVMWCDGSVNKLSESSSELHGESTRITYVPQLYINHLAEEKGEKHLSELIEEILLQNDSFKAVREYNFGIIHEELAKIKANIENLIQQKDLYQRLFREKQEIGNSEKVASEIKRINNEIDVLRKSAGFSETENKTFETLNTKEKSYQKRVGHYDSTLISIKEFSDYVLALQEKLTDAIKKKRQEYSSDRFESFFLDKLISNFESSIEDAFQKFSEESELYISKFSDKQNSLVALKQEIVTKLAPFKEKIQNQNQLNALLEKLKIETNKVNQIQEKQKEIQKVLERARQVREEIVNSYSTLFDAYFNIESELQKTDYKSIGDDLELQSKLSFDFEKFSKFTSLFDGRSKLNQAFYGAFDEDNNFQFNKSTHIDTTRLIFDKIRELHKLDIRLKTNTTDKDLYSQLFDDNFKFNYSINYKGDNILKMSPGKRGVVLLELILHISNASHPILIDQPEDNLDNRTIYDELKEYIVEKKIKRQIILVTHNANLVVSTDAENIIVANQAGQQKDKDKREFKFEFISGALENTFKKPDETGILYKYGVREHVCDILEGGIEAFKKREQQYGIQ